MSDTRDRRPELPEASELLRCPNCGQDRARGVDHRCAAPGLIELSPEALLVVEAVRSVGDELVVVGGAVRDRLLGREPTDVDFEIAPASRDRLRAALTEVGYVGTRGASYELMVVAVHGREFELSIVDPELDAAGRFGRRDFTLNAIGWSPATEELIDPWAGAVDLEEGVLRHTTPQSLGTDPLRVLRGVRFAGTHGFRFHADTAVIAQSLRDEWDSLPTDRIWAEWRRLGRTATDWPAALRALDDTAWTTLFPELETIHDTPQDPSWHPEGTVWAHTALAAAAAAEICSTSGITGVDRDVVVLGALVHDLGKAECTVVEPDGRITSRGHADAGVAPAESFLKRIGAPASVRDRVLPIVREHMAHTIDQPTRAAVRRLVRRLHPATLQDWIPVVSADVGGRGAASQPFDAHRWEALAADTGQLPAKPLLRGEHLVALGLEPGPRFGELIRESLEAQDDGVFDDEAGAAAWAAERLELGG
ncbi:HDIG domain-containing metalloprotein [Agromyces albus]|uniref:HDIG domain-containing metalloprotein n=1 Tax=Agromyces albus TaxID=205332 RepID=UPI002788A541|nr:HDIG domain-containing metalloprotein [Agromyces albus]MDQ0575065.1 tRNA nucleotidyltransferase (CCA-adding enzyme) [Agromyces albus]